MPLIVSIALVIICWHGKLLLGQFYIFGGFDSLRIVLIAKIACKRAELGSDNRSYVYYTWKYCHGRHENIIVKTGVALHKAQGQWSNDLWPVLSSIGPAFDGHLKCVSLA